MENIVYEKASSVNGAARLQWPNIVEIHCTYFIIHFYIVMEICSTVNKFVAEKHFQTINGGHPAYSSAAVLQAQGISIVSNKNVP